MVHFFKIIFDLTSNFQMLFCIGLVLTQKHELVNTLSTPNTPFHFLATPFRSICTGTGTWVPATLRKSFFKQHTIFLKMKIAQIYLRL